jgi:hypothetical protein
MRFGQKSHPSFEIERDISTPVEERLEKTLTEQYTITRWQARDLGWAVALFVLSALFFILACGPQTALVAWALLGALLLVHWLRRGDGLTLAQMAAGVLVVALSGAVTWVTWQIATFLFPLIPIYDMGLPEWVLSLIPWVRGLVALWAMAGMIFCAVRAGFLMLAFGWHALVQSSFIARALGQILEAVGIYWGTQDVVVEAEPPKVTRLEITTRDEQGRVKAMHTIDAPLPSDKMRLLAHHIITDGPYSEPALGSRGAGILSRTQYEQMRDWLMGRGCLVWKNPANHNDGLEVTRGGMSLFRAYLRATAPPLPAVSGTLSAHMPNENERTQDTQMDELG